MRTPSRYRNLLCRGGQVKSVLHRSSVRQSLTRRQAGSATESFYQPADAASDDAHVKGKSRVMPCQGYNGIVAGS